ncbi:hypothetical protein CLV76_101335 [Marivita geojedonensis]|nr:hypothetical protein CLV76_101335 [Marivita geojedonensis]
MQAVNTKGAADKRGVRVKRLLAVILAAAVLYSGWWIYAAQDMRRGLEDWFEDQRNSSWQATFSDLSVRGFPNRTDATVTDPLLLSPDGTIGWRAPFLQILGLSYKHGHVIVVPSDTQTLTTPDGEIGLSSDGLRASVIFEDQTVLRSNLEAMVLNLTGPERAVAMAGVSAALEKTDTAPGAYRAAVSVESIAVSPSNVTTNMGPDSLASLRAEMDLVFDTPLRIDGLTDAPPPRDITLQRSEITYGSVTFKLTGSASFDMQGRATGEVNIAAENWRDAIEAARNRGDLPPALSEGLIDLLSMLSSLSGARDALDVTLGLDRGTVLIGPIPIGTLPPLQWR